MKYEAIDIVSSERRCHLFALILLTPEQRTKTAVTPLCRKAPRQRHDKYLYIHTTKFLFVLDERPRPLFAVWMALIRL